MGFDDNSRTRAMVNCQHWFLLISTCVEIRRHLGVMSRLVEFLLGVGRGCN
jgi:hypothetical protein